MQAVPQTQSERCVALLADLHWRRGSSLLRLSLLASVPWVLPGASPNDAWPFEVWKFDLWFLFAVALVLAGLSPGAARLLAPLCSAMKQRLSFGQGRRLETAARSQIEELSRESMLGRSLSRVLVTLVSNRSVGETLDGICRLIRDRIPGVETAILVNGDSGWRLASAPGLRAGWLSCLSVSDLIPSEIWKQARTVMEPISNPVWRDLAAEVFGELPAAIHSCRIGTEDAPLGVILVLEGRCRTPGREGPAAESGSGPSMNHALDSVLETASRLAQLAIERGLRGGESNFRAHPDTLNTLTSLPNQTLLLGRLEAELAEAHVHARSLAVLFIDLDHFKQINERISCQTGDLFLREVHERMRGVLRGSDTVARTGGDEFNVILCDVAGPEEVAETAARLLAVIREPFVAGGCEVSATASIGVSLFPRDGSTAGHLLTRANLAMHSAKAAGRNQMHVFSGLVETAGQSQMEREIRSALAEERFLLHYQPKMTADGRLAGLEALVRLRHPQRGIILPAEFIPVAEATGLIVPVGNWVLDEVCRQIVRWKQQGCGQVPVAVNASPVQLERPDFAQSVEDCLARYSVPAWSIEIELTENLFIQNGGESLRQMRALRSLGVRFSIDDFGAGYSALSYLHQLPIDAIKLDRSFVQGLEASDAVRRIVSGLLTVARGLGLNVVAEGVETEGQKAALLGLGCPQMQGYYFARPCPAEQLLELLTRSATPKPDSIDAGCMPADLCALAGATGESCSMRGNPAALV